MIALAGQSGVAAQRKRGRRDCVRPRRAAGVKRNSLASMVPRRASAAASRGSETAGVNMPVGRALSAVPGRAALARGVVAASAGASSSAIATSDAPPAVPMARKLLKRLVSPRLPGI